VWAHLLPRVFPVSRAGATPSVDHPWGGGHCVVDPQGVLEGRVQVRCLWARCSWCGGIVVGVWRVHLGTLDPPPHLHSPRHTHTRTLPPPPPCICFQRPRARPGALFVRALPRGRRLLGRCGACRGRQRHRAGQRPGAAAAHRGAGGLLGRCPQRWRFLLPLQQRPRVRGWPRRGPVCVRRGLHRPPLLRVCRGVRAHPRAPPACARAHAPPAPSRPLRKHPQPASDAPVQPCPSAVGGRQGQGVCVPWCGRLAPPPPSAPPIPVRSCWQVL
jgi:hypothetical protein